MSKPVTQEVRVGSASVRQTFQASKAGRQSGKKRKETKTGNLQQLTRILGQEIETGTLRWGMPTTHT
jgi:hypothetical protein